MVMNDEVMKKSVSFAQDERHIYDFAMKKLSFSIYVKELILKDMQSAHVHSDKPADLNFNF
jgi:hypothetical protein